jgi:hypothetical protein
MPARKLATVPQVVAQYPAFTIGSLRWLLFRRHENGLAHAVVKIGRKRLLIDIDSFELWLDAQREVGA